MSERRTGYQRLALKSSGHELQLVGGCAGAVDVAGRDLDLDLCLEQRHAPQLSVRWQLLRGHPEGPLQRVPYAVHRSGYVSLGQAHEREAGLGIPTCAMSREQRLLCAFDVALTKANPSELAQRPPHLASQVWTKLVARLERLMLCLGA